MPAAASSPACTTPSSSPGSAATDSQSDRGISGALALWGPLIIIGFLVLVLNTDNAPRAPAPREAAVVAPSGEAVAPPEAFSVPPAVESVAGEEDGGAPAAAPQVSEAAPAVETAPAEPVVRAADPAADAPSPGEPDVAAVTPGLGVTPEGQALEAVAPEAAARAGDLDLGTVLEVARSVIGQADEDARAETAAASGAPPAPEAPGAPGSPNPPPQALPPAPVTGAPAGAASGAAPYPGSAPAAVPGAEPPIWSTGDNPWAASSPSPDEAVWGEGSGPLPGPGGNPEWPPAPESGAVMPPLPPAAAMMPGSGYWPRPPVLVPCAPPWYWCIPLPAPMYHPPPPGSY